MSKGSIIYIGGFLLPDKNAAANRAMANAKVFQQIGYKVIFIGVKKSSNDFNIFESEILEGFECYSVTYPRNIQEWFKYLIAIKTLKKIVQKYNDVKFIISYNYPSVAQLRINNFCRKRGIKTLSDCTEWYGSIEGSLVLKIIKFLDTNFRIRYVNKNADGIIVVSNYLKKYYSKQKNILIPTLLDYNKKYDYAYSDNKCVQLAYAGIPFRLGKPLKNRKLAKDRLDKSILLLHQLHKRGLEFKFSIYGITEEQYLTVLPEDKEIIQELKGKIYFYGFLENTMIRLNIQQSDFTLLLREENRITNAGFPTKFTESIMSGTPVITTKTSDLENYLVEGKNGFFITIDDNNVALDKLEKILKSDRGDIEKLKKYCKESRVFDLDNWVEESKSFFEKV